MIKKITNIDQKIMNECENDILLNKQLTNVSPSNMYEILFDSENFDKIFNIFLNELKEQTNKNFDVYVKNMWGYVQDETDNQPINLIRNFKNQIIIPSQYSFIYPIKANVTSVFIKKDDNIQNIILTKGDMLIFKTIDFIKEESDTNNRIILVGSASDVVGNIQEIKKVII